MPLGHRGGGQRAPQNEWVLFMSMVYYVLKFEPVKIQNVISTVALYAVKLRRLSHNAGLITAQTTNDSHL